MKLLGAFEDFVGNTLTRMPNTLRRLQFIAGMRSAEGYEHWGMSKVYGRDAAQRAIGEAHANTFEQVLTTPIPRLAEGELEEAARDLANGDTMLPSDLRGGSKRHLSWILKAVYLLRRSPQGTNRAA